MHKAVPDGIDWGGLTPENDASQLLHRLALLAQGPGRRLRPRRVRGRWSSSMHGHDPKDDRNFAVAPRPADHPHGQQDRPPARAQGPRLGRRHRGAQEHEPRLGQQRRPVAQHARHQRLQPVHPPGRQPPDHPQEVRPADHGRDQGGLPEGPVRPEPRVGSGRTTPSSSRPTRWRWTTSSGESSTPSARRRTCRRSPPPARPGLDPLGTEGFDIRQPQHIPLAGNLGLGIFDFKTDQTKPGQAVIDHRIVSV